MYRYQERIVKEAARLYAFVKDGEQFFSMDNGSDGVVVIDRRNPEHVPILIATLAAFLDEMGHVVETLDREVETLSEELFVAETVGDDLSKAIAEHDLFPPGDPEPPF